MIVFTVELSQGKDIPCAVLLPEDGQIDSIKTVHDLIDECRIDSEAATATSKADQDMIRNEIQQNASFQTVNTVVEHALWLELMKLIDRQSAFWFEDDCGEWQRYAQNVEEEIRDAQALRRDKVIIHQMDGRGWQYEVDLKAMEQTNLITGKKRKITQNRKIPTATSVAEEVLAQSSAGQDQDTE
eukprot:TRINITY_DN1442_c0_g1_i1.p1 TRINITY_DN1442_c0_g1~~TRINITY_DN1442_c0_g1_i1.p1  ORF type:complete len:185 (+),score=40.79 TRINITY_DN1442_c0_g1_i1:53-607(+)